MKRAESIGAARYPTSASRIYVSNLPTCQRPTQRGARRWDHISFNGTLRDELLNEEIFYSLNEAQIVNERWRHDYNEVRPHSSLGYGPPARAACSPKALILAQPQML